jgi:hypothetical protein
VDLVIHEVRQLQHVDLTDCHRIRERLAGATVAQPYLSARGDSRKAHQLCCGLIDFDISLLAE